MSKMIQNKNIIKLTPPLSNEDVERLKIGDKVLLSGTIYTARDAAHKRLADTLKRGEKPPFNLKGQIIYYTGPAPARPGMVIGPAGPTTSCRMDPYTVFLIKAGIKGTIGKGSRSERVKEALKKYKAVYFVATGGVAAFLSECIKKAEIIAYEDLGTEAIYRFEVKDFPLIVANDVKGADLYKENIQRYRKI